MVFYRWGFAEGYMELVINTKTDGTVDRSRIPITSAAVTHHEVLRPYACRPNQRRALYNGALSDEELNELGPFGRLRYGDGSAAGESANR